PAPAASGRGGGGVGPDAVWASLGVAGAAGAGPAGAITDREGRVRRGQWTRVDHVLPGRYQDAGRGAAGPAADAQEGETSMTSSMTIDCAFHITRRSRGRQEMQAGESPRTPCERGRVPRVTKLLALAHRFEGLVRNSEVADYAALARLGRVSRARVSQI